MYYYPVHNFFVFFFIVRATCPSHPILLDLIALTILDYERKL